MSNIHDGADTLSQSLHNEQFRTRKRFRLMARVFNVGFALLFAWLQIWLLVASYVAGFLFFEWYFNRIDRAGARTHWLAPWIWLVILIQALLAVLILGPDAGFQFYLIVTLIQTFLRQHRSIAYKITLGVAVFLIFIFADNWFFFSRIYHVLPSEVINALRHFNIFGLCVILAWTAHANSKGVQDAEQALLHIANSDPLTGLLNRRALQKIADHELERCKRCFHPTSLLLCDVDYFKQVNDKLGHSAGDHVLQVVAARLQSQLREYDYLARWGGEEFLVLLPEADITKAAITAERLRHAVESLAITFEGKSIPVTVTFGVSQVQGDEKWGAAIVRADEALYRGKKLGRNRVEKA